MANACRDFLFTDFYDLMNLESLSPFLLLLAPFAIAFFMEALVVYFFRLKPFWLSVGLCFLINLLTLGVLYAGSVLLSKLGYRFDGLLLPLQILLLFWWLSVVADGFFLFLFSKKGKQIVYFCSLVMNSLSYLFLYIFIANTH